MRSHIYCQELKREGAVKESVIDGILYYSILSNKKHNLYHIKKYEVVYCNIYNVLI